MQNSIGRSSTDLSGAADFLDDSKLLLERASQKIQKSSGFFDQLQSTLIRLEAMTGTLSKISSAAGSSEVDQVAGCRRAAAGLDRTASDLRGMFDDAVGAGSAGKTLRAASAYKTISAAVDAAREAGFHAMDAALEAYAKLNPPDLRTQEGGFMDLGREAEMSRIRSEDLRQEAHGLQRNSADMSHQLERLRVSWRERSVLVAERLRDIDEVMREALRLPGSGQSGDAARAALFSATEALAEAERTWTMAGEAEERVLREMAWRMRELKSFSPEELSNIPRQST